MSPVATAINESFERIVSAGCIPGTPATAETVAGVLKQGVRYVYTHVPRLIAASAKAFFEKAGD